MESKSTIARDDLEAISEELSNIYGFFCEGNSETPSATMLDHRKASLKIDTTADPESRKAVGGQRKSDSDAGNGAENGIDYGSTNDRLLDTICDQLRHLKKAVDKTSELCRQNNLFTGNRNGTSIEGDHPGTLPLESLLTIKDEQIATLRAVLKANKQSAEVAISNLKSKYENEKVIVSETMRKLRDELNILRTYKDSFVSLRSLFVTKCDSFINQLNDIQTHLLSSEEDIKEISMFMSYISSPSDESKELDEDE